MKKIIIFGATGNVGSYVHKYACEYFKNRYEVVASGHRQTDFFTKHGQKYVSVDLQTPGNGTSAQRLQKWYCQSDFLTDKGLSCSKYL